MKATNGPIRVNDMSDHPYLWQMFTKTVWVIWRFVIPYFVFQVCYLVFLGGVVVCIVFYLIFRVYCSFIYFLYIFYIQYIQVTLRDMAVLFLITEFMTGYWLTFNFQVFKLGFVTKKLETFFFNNTNIVWY